MNLFGKKYSAEKLQSSLSTKAIKETGIKIFRSLWLELDLPMDDHLERIYFNYFEVEYYAKGELIFSNLESTKSIYLILNGIVEYITDLENQEMTLLILNDGNVCANFNLITGNIEPYYSCRAIKDCILYTINPISLHILMKSENKEGIKLFIEKIKSLTERFMIELLLVSKLPAKEKTKKLMRDYSELFKNVPQAKISNLLGIQPETFSRIKNVQNT